MLEDRPDNFTDTIHWVETAVSGDRLSDGYGRNTYLQGVIQNNHLDHRKTNEARAVNERKQAQLCRTVASDLDELKTAVPESMVRYSAWNLASDVSLTER